MANTNGNKQLNISASGFLLMQEKIETQRGENKILRQKLQSKAEALLILSKELDKVRTECDDYRELTRRLQTQCSVLKTTGGVTTDEEHSTSSNNNIHSFNSRAFRDHTVASRLAQLRDDNKRLIDEREHLRNILQDRESDVKLIRSQWLKEKNARNATLEEQQQATTQLKTKTRNKVVSTADLVKKLEIMEMKYTGLKRDLQGLLDEKVDLVQERDAYKCKVHRLNHSMAALLKSEGYQSIDVDSLLSENRFLHESLVQVREEKELANEMGRRYKKALDKTKVEAAPSTTNNVPAVDDIQELIAKASFPCPPDLDLNSAQSLHELALSLLETLNDRMMQLKQQRRANKHLMARLAEIENKISAAANSSHPDAAELTLWPSKYLMKGYSSAHVDEDQQAIEASLEELDRRLKLSRQSSMTTSSATAEDEEEMSPDVADLYKRFQAITPGQQKNESSQLQKPDIIDFQHIDKDIEENHDDDDDDEPIVLPDHLQKMVDQAVANIRNE